MSVVKQLLRWRWRPPVPAAAPSADPAPVVYTVRDSSHQFHVYAMRDGKQVGFCLASAHALLQACFVSDLMVFAPADRRQGIGAELVRRAWRHSGCPTVVPVNVVTESALWWAKRAQEQTIPIQLGITYQQEQMLRFAATYQTPSPSPEAPSVRKAPDSGGSSAQSRALDRLPPLVVKAAADHFRVVTAPSPEFRATLHNGAGEEVGTAKYGLSPLGDRVYVYDIRVPPAHQRCGYATALLWYLAREYGRPITPVQELHAASGFWNAARALAGAGVVVTEPVWDLEAEAARWAHLRPDAERLAEQILERLHVRREPWQVAVGRGLDAEAPAARSVGAPCAADRDGPSPG